MHKRSWAFLASCGLALGLVLFRSFPFLAYEHLDFDSDQAIVGLMAKHLAELRTFPLFFYGQHYMLGVQAWIAAPFVWAGGPTVAMLRTPLVIVNAIVAIWLVRIFTRSTGSPWLALAAVLPLAAAGPVLSANLLETLGASVEPFLYVLVLWALRDRPLAFGAMLSAGFLHREFTIFALGAIGVASWRERRHSCLADVGWVTRAAAAFAAVWLAVDQLKRHINTLGPPGGAYTTAPLTLQFESLLSRAAPDPPLIVAKLRQAVTEVVPDLLGMRAVPPAQYNINSMLTVGSRAVAIVLLAAGVICAGRLAVQWLRGRRSDTPVWPSPFTIYLAAVGVQALLVYSLSNAVNPAAAPILRYALLALYLPIALVSAFFEAERRPGFKAAVAAFLAAAALLNARDTGRVIAEYGRHPAPSEHRMLADDLVAHGNRYGSAIYADAYITSFFAGERVILNSTEKMRIAAYEAAVSANAGTAVRVMRLPCGVGRRVASWCIVDPPRH